MFTRSKQLMEVKAVSSAEWNKSMSFYSVQPKQIYRQTQTETEMEWTPPKFAVWSFNVFQLSSPLF